MKVAWLTDVHLEWLNQNMSRLFLKPVCIWGNLQRRGCHSFAVSPQAML